MKGKYFSKVKNNEEGKRYLEVLRKLFPSKFFRVVARYGGPFRPMKFVDGIKVYGDHNSRTGSEIRIYVTGR